MKNIKLFEEFILENRQDLYHVTFNLMGILKDDELKTSEPSFGIEGKNSISVTRSKFYTCDYGEIKSRIVLNTNLLKKHGWLSYPFDEIGFYGKRSGHSKSNYKFRQPKHKLNLPPSEMDKKGLDLEIEYEERFYKNIKPLGKFIKYIDLSKEMYDTYKENSFFNNYLKKYPHIKIRLIDKNCNVKIKDHFKKKEFSH